MSVIALRQFAASRDGVFSLHTAARFGLTLRALRRMEARGEVVQIHPKVFRFTVAAVTPRSLIRGAVEGGRGLAVASHSSAAFLHGLAGPAGRPEITLAGSVPCALTDVRVHRSRSLPRVDVVSVNQIQTTSGPRTVIDLAARLVVNDRLDLLDRAICKGVASRSVTHARASALSHGRRGVATIVEATHPDADGEFWSALERMFGARIGATDLPRPAFNVPMRYRGRMIRVDALWESARLVVELQGLRFHTQPDDKLRDDERHNILTHLGYRSLVFDWRAVNERFADVAAEIALALGGSRDHMWA